MSIRFTRRGALGVASVGLIGASLATPALSQARQRLTIATGGTGGVFFPYGGGLARILTEKMPNTQATGQVTGGSVDNVKLLHQGDADIGFSTLDSAYDGTQGAGAYQRDGRQDVRVLAVLYDSFLHIVADARVGELTNIAAMRGRRISVGSAGSSTESIADRVIAAAGLNHMRDITRDNLGVAESAGALKDGKVAAFFWIGGVPTAAVRDLATSGSPPLRFLPTTNELAALERQFPGQYRPFNLPANAYAGQTAAVDGECAPAAGDAGPHHHVRQSGGCAGDSPRSAPVDAAGRRREDRRAISPGGGSVLPLARRSDLSFRGATISFGVARSGPIGFDRPVFV
jgi:TRAP transporter TAXI family solute receptor